MKKTGIADGWDENTIKDIDLRKLLFREKSKDLLGNLPVDGADTLGRLLERAFRAGVALARKDPDFTPLQSPGRRMTDRDIPSISRPYLTRFRQAVFGRGDLDGLEDRVGHPGNVIFHNPGVAAFPGRWVDARIGYGESYANEKVLGPLLVLGILKKVRRDNTVFIILSPHGYKLLRTGSTSLPREQTELKGFIAVDYKRQLTEDFKSHAALVEARANEPRQIAARRLYDQHQVAIRKTDLRSAHEKRVDSGGGVSMALRILKIIDDGELAGRSRDKAVMEIRGLGVGVPPQNLMSLRFDLSEGLRRMGTPYVRRFELSETEKKDRRRAIRSGIPTSIIHSRKYPAKHRPSTSGYARLKRFDADPEILAELGVASIDQMVDMINDARRAAGNRELPQGDFPTNKGTFERAVKEFRKLIPNAMSGMR